jgi:hypothetical protein
MTYIGIQEEEASTAAAVWMLQEDVFIFCVIVCFTVVLSCYYFLSFATVSALFNVYITSTLGTSSK